VAFATSSVRVFSGYYKNETLQKTNALLVNIGEEIATFEN
jgi:hypothetical protein